MAVRINRALFARAYRTRHRHVVGKMNQTEARYAAYLNTRKIAGEVQEWYFEPLKLRLADKTFYTPDFMVLTREWIIELHEVKGFMEDDAAVKLKVAAETFPCFRFLLCAPSQGGWKVKETGNASRD